MRGSGGNTLLTVVKPFIPSDSTVGKPSFEYSVTES